jgi:hypothetical protein
LEFSLQQKSKNQKTCVFQVWRPRKTEETSQTVIRGNENKVAISDWYHIRNVRWYVGHWYIYINNIYKYILYHK